jgi:hypothetical protein
LRDASEPFAEDQTDHETEIERSKFEYFFGTNWAVFRSDLDKSGLFSEDLGPSPVNYPAAGAETELQQRLIKIKTGVRAITYLALVHHPVCISLEAPLWADAEAHVLPILSPIFRCRREAGQFARASPTISV